MSIIDLDLRDIGFAVVNIKTTGLTPGYDRICELSVVRADPGQPLRLALDTLVHPGREMASVEIHGIQDRDVLNAPVFLEVANDLVRELANRVLVGHNLSFTMRFLETELAEFAGVRLYTPYIDTMAFDALLRRGSHRPLADACRGRGIDPTRSDLAAAGALDTAKLLRLLLSKVRDMGLRTFKALRGSGKLAFQQSFERPLVGIEATYTLPESVTRSSRWEGSSSHEVRPASAYYDALLVALDDLVITDEELEDLAKLRKDLGLDLDDIYGLHAMVFAGELIAMFDEVRLDDHKRGRLQRLRHCLSTLGWCPGD